MDEMTKLALIGTSRGAGGHAKTGTPVDALVEKAGVAEAERALLLRAGSAAMMAAGAVTPTTLDILPPPAPPETLPECPPAVATVIEPLLAGSERELQILAGNYVQQAGMRVSPNLLTMVLDLRINDVREAWRHTLGERGRWLATLNPEWKWAREIRVEIGESLPANAKQIWDEGHANDRLAVLKLARQADPAVAREWVRETWKSEKAENRLEFLGTFAEKLSADDEPFLVEALTDRSANVKQLAADLLLRVPTSALAARSRERAADLLAYQAGVTAKKKAEKGAKSAKKVRRRSLANLAKMPAPTGTLTATLPNAFDKTWANDGITDDAPVGLGKKSWWLLQLIGRVDPNFWVTKFNATPTEIVSAAFVSDDAPAVVIGLSQAVRRFDAKAWIGPVWDALNSLDDLVPNGLYSEVYETIETLTKQMPPAEIETRMMAALAGGNDEMLEMLDASVFAVLPRPWRPEFARAVVAGIREISAKAKDSRSYSSYPDSFSLPIVAVAIPRECLADVLAGPWAILDGDEDKFSWVGHEWRREITKFVDRIRTRQTLLETLGL